MQPLAFFNFAEKYRCENGSSTTPRFISFPLQAFWSMILRRKRPERKDEVHEFPIWNVHKAHGRSTAVARNAPSRTQTIILQVICGEMQIVKRPRKEDPSKNVMPSWTAQARFAWTTTHDEPRRSGKCGYIAGGRLRAALTCPIWAPRACAVLDYWRHGVAWQRLPVRCLLPCIGALLEKENFQLFCYGCP